MPIKVNEANIFVVSCGRKPNVLLKNAGENNLHENAKFINSIYSSMPFMKLVFIEFEVKERFIDFFIINFLVKSNATSFHKQFLI